MPGQNPENAPCGQSSRFCLIECTQFTDCQLLKSEIVARSPADIVAEQRQKAEKTKLRKRSGNKGSGSPYNLSRHNG